MISYPSPPAMDTQEISMMDSTASAATVAPQAASAVEPAICGLTKLIHETAMQRTRLAENSVRVDMNKLSQANQRRQLLQDVLEQIRSVQGKDGTIDCSKLDRGLFTKLRDQFEDLVTNIPGVQQFSGVLKLDQARNFLNELSMREKSEGTLSTTGQMELSNNMRHLQTTVEFFLAMINRAHDLCRKIIETLARG
ncbi:MAG: hypothetical protein ACOYKZ_06660 [Chlamydiia bacterium]